ncbi:hypothetical protein LTR53_019051, partial [Teratosphaeriaceae sp. CCFEE 6253]
PTLPASTARLSSTDEPRLRSACRLALPASRWWLWCAARTTSRPAAVRPATSAGLRSPR